LDELECVTTQLKQYKESFLKLIQKRHESSEEDYHGIVYGLGDKHFVLDDELMDEIVANALSDEYRQLPQELVLLMERGLNDSPDILSKCMPIILKQVHKSSGFEKALRIFEELVTPLYETIIELARHCLSHFSRPSHVLEREFDDIGDCVGYTANDLLFIGTTFVIDFSLKPSTSSSSSSTTTTTTTTPYRSTTKDSPAMVVNSTPTNSYRLSPVTDWNSETSSPEG
jgi:hypothetical protein